jgi:pimeloyl-ACP methyl ester carboxylesterase
MTTFVLVHGAWHGAWCWDKLVPELERLGHRVVTLDLPGAGQDNTPVESITLDSYAARVTETLDTLDEKAILVGHSMGGMSVTAAAELRPEKIKTLVYLTAMLPRNGESLFDIEGRNENSSVPEAIVPSGDGRTANVLPDRIKDLFYHDCSDEDIEFAMERLSPQPMAILEAPVSLSDENFGSVPRCYIECLDDHAIGIALQRDMISASPCGQVLQINTSHSPFLSKPKELAELLSQVT